ncbi:MAG: carbohydrate ABC transporter permease [Hyphomicrobiales bacterium]
MEQTLSIDLAPSAIRPRSRRRSFAKLSARVAPFLFLAPALVALGTWIFWPLIEAFRLSFYEWNLLPTSPKTFVGLENYRRIIELPELRRAAWNTVLYTLGLLPLTVGLPLAIALATRSIGGRAGGIYRALVFVPMIIAPVVAAIVWRWLLDPDSGIVNACCAGSGCTRPLSCRIPASRSGRSCSSPAGS